MNHRRWNLLLLVLLILLVAANVAVQPRPTRRLPNLPWTNMDRSAAATSFEANAAFANGQTLQHPPDGVVQVGQAPLHFTADEADAPRAGRRLRNPLDATDPRVLARGEEVFATYCVVCHGAGMLGDGSVTRRGVPAPPSLLTEAAAARPDGELFWIITYGRRTMPAYASQVEPEDRWRVIAYLRAKQEEARP